MEVDLGYHPMRMPTQGRGELEGRKGKWGMALPFRAEFNRGEKLCTCDSWHGHRQSPPGARAGRLLGVF